MITSNQILVLIFYQYVQVSGRGVLGCWFLETGGDGDESPLDSQTCLWGDLSNFVKS